MVGDGGGCGGGEDNGGTLLAGDFLTTSAACFFTGDLLVDFDIVGLSFFALVFSLALASSLSLKTPAARI